MSASGRSSSFTVCCICWCLDVGPVPPGWPLKHDEQFRVSLVHGEGDAAAACHVPAGDEEEGGGGRRSSRTATASLERSRERGSSSGKYHSVAPALDERRCRTDPQTP